MLKDRNEKKYQKYEEESKTLTVELDKEKKAKFDMEKEKYALSRELRDTQKMVKKSTVKKFMFIFSSSWKILKKKKQDKEKKC